MVDADIQGCFDQIDQEKLLQIIGQFPAREMIRAWLKAGYLEQDNWHPTETGTPQGGVISPLLANIALHGMESALGVTYDKSGHLRSPRLLVHYADDFVVFCQSQDDAQQCIQDVTIWLAERGLALSQEKTQVVHLQEGFDFLGFNIRHYRNQNTATGWKLLIKPSKASVQAMRDKLKHLWHAYKGYPLGALIHAMNPVIRGWANYFRTKVASESFSHLDNWMFLKAVKFVRHRHPKQPKQWRLNRYWGRFDLNRQDNWMFGDKQSGAYLLKFSHFDIQRHTLVKDIQRHTLVKGNASPDDPALKDYWELRRAKPTQSLTRSRRRLVLSQRFICPVCKESLFNQEPLHLHHKVPKSEGGKDSASNLVLVHFFCHHQLHFFDC